MRKNAKLTLGFLAVLAAPFAVNETDAQAATGWVANGNTWYYYNAQGQQVRNTWIGNYYLGADGRMATNAWVDNNRYYVGANGAWVPNAQKEEVKTGWVANGNTWYYYNAQGQQVRNTWIGNYYLGADGRMVTNAWVDNNKYYVGANGAWVPGAKKQVTDGWVKEGTTWYFYKNGEQVKNAWAGNYYLGADGKMMTNAWIGQYYVGSDGAWIRDMHRGWVASGNTWYYYNDNGQLVKNAWAGNYYLGADGRMATNAWVDNNKYYVDANGAWVPGAKKQVTDGWVKEGTTWYFYKNGEQVKNAWAGNYYLGADGKMATNAWIGQYYVDANGAWVQNKHRGWVKENNTWYYYNDNAQRVTNAWAGNYYLGADGKMVTSSWVDNDKYYVDENGAWVKDKKKEEVSDKNKDTKKEQQAGWVNVEETWYFFNKDGQQAKNTWVGNYWLGSDGKMATNAWVDNGRYYVGANGAWVKDAVNNTSTPGWKQVGSTWYYYNNQGQLVKNAWAGNYWLGSDGKMATNAWVDNGRYYVGANGAWVKNPTAATGSSSLESVLNIARDYLGVQTGTATHKKIVDAYNSVNPKPVGYTAKYTDDWCDIFVTTVFQQAGLSDLIGRECGVQRHIGIMQQKGIWQGRSMPKVGDVVTFDWDGGGFADHIGIVESVNNGVITTIEGNSAQYAGQTAPTKVNRKTYDWNSRYIKGYARPAY